MKVFLLILLFSPCILTTQDKIINGTSAEHYEFPFMVSLRNNSRHFCGGTTLNKKFILTAAHCVCSVTLSNFTIHLTYFLENPKKIILTKSVICHSNYSQLEHINDIAIIELEHEVPDYLYKPVHLVAGNFSCEKDRQGLLVGWGLTEKGTVSNALTKVDVIVYNDTTCTKSHFEMYDMEKNMCAGWPENGKGSCQGDSGGPLLIEGFQAGIISFGISSNCGISSRQQPKILTRVSEYVDWIQENSKYEENGNADAGNNATLDKILFWSILLICFRML